MPAPVKCTICSLKISFPSVHSDSENRFPLVGQGHPGQEVIACSGCGALLHRVEEANTTISWHHLWFSNMRMRAFIEEHGLVGYVIALCKGCHEQLGEQILESYRALEKFDEGARFLEDFGRADEAGDFLAAIKG